MKFNKTVAQALANKVRKNLVENRSTFITNYKPSDKVQKEVEQLVGIYMEAKTAMIEARNKLDAYDDSYYIYNKDTVEDIVRGIIKGVAEKNAPKIPRTEDLIDDFLIEAIDAENAEELIAKVTAKYVA